MNNNIRILFGNQKDTGSRSMANSTSTSPVTSWNRPILSKRTQIRPGFIESVNNYQNIEGVLKS